MDEPTLPRKIADAIALAEGRWKAVARGLIVPLLLWLALSAVVLAAPAEYFYAFPGLFLLRVLGYLFPVGLLFAGVLVASVAVSNGGNARAFRALLRRPEQIRRYRLIDVRVRGLVFTHVELVLEDGSRPRFVPADQSERHLAGIIMDLGTLAPSAAVGPG